MLKNQKKKITRKEYENYMEELENLYDFIVNRLVKLSISLIIVFFICKAYDVFKTKESIIFEIIASITFATLFISIFYTIFLLIKNDIMINRKYYKRK